ncbi:hypothetical protein Fmac_025664 [Flemingia macrophylla]|uniref:Uncharacterized protein n=1 Tax=Flemingia macrophylla TaxID=520843 RepID=A0ABD1LSV1_9FABA
MNFWFHREVKMKALIVLTYEVEGFALIDVTSGLRFRKFQLSFVHKVVENVKNEAQETEEGDSKKEKVHKVVEDVQNESQETEEGDSKKRKKKNRRTKNGGSVSAGRTAGGNMWRLPMKDVIRFKCVSKWCGSMVGDPKFLRKHFGIAIRAPLRAPRCLQRLGLLYGLALPTSLPPLPFPLLEPRHGAHVQPLASRHAPLDRPHV